MYRLSSAYLAVAAVLGAASMPRAQAGIPPRSGPEPSPPVVAPAPPAFKAGAIVTDRNGARLGPIQSLALAPSGPLVVIRIDGKLVSVPQSTLTLENGSAVSSQTKAEILTAAGAPR